MKQYIVDGKTVIVGETDEIKCIEKSMRKAYWNDRSYIGPVFLDPPKFREGGIYGIMIENDDVGQRSYVIVNADTICRLLNLG